MTPAQREAAARLADTPLHKCGLQWHCDVATLLRELVEEPEPAPGYCKHCRQYTIEEPLPADPQGEPVQEPERMGLDAIRSAIEDRDAIEAKYHDLAEHMVYRGNSVSWWHSKAIAYRDAIDNVWRELKAAGIVCDGKKTCADGVRELAAPQQRKPLTVGEIDLLWYAPNPIKIAPDEVHDFARAVERAHGIGDGHDK